MKHSPLTRMLSLLLAAVLVLGIMPVAAFATEVVEVSEEALPTEPAAEAQASVTMPSNMTVISDKESTLAPGITLDEVVVYDKDGNRVEIFVSTADLSVDTVGVYANYLNNQNTVLGMSKLTEQVVAAEKNHAEPYSVVSGINASYYNMTTGKPTGAFVMEGNDITTESEGNAYSFFAILDDGTAFIGGKNEYSTMKSRIVEAVGGYIHLIEDGKICSGLNSTTKYPRQTVGITADGKVITMTADGSQAPKSIGLTVQEQAEVMLALGCVEAIHLDGGGSCTYGAKPEGEDSFRILNSPSDGSERSVSNTLIFVSTAVPDGSFDHASLTAETEYVTPGSSVIVSATGVDAAGGSADIPADIFWQLADSAMGTVVNGVFTSSGVTGDAVVQMIYNGSVVGSTTIHVVIPDSLCFAQSEMVAPYGKTITLDVTATYGVNEVTLKDGDIVFTLSNDTLGTISGFSFTAAEEGIEDPNGVITAALAANPSVTCTANLSLGKGSDVLFDFENQSMGSLCVKDAENYNYIYAGNVMTVTEAANGQVRHGDYALQIDLDYSNSYESGYMLTSLSTTEDIVIENALTLGMWMYIPEEAVGMRIRACLYDANNKRFTSELMPIGKISTLETPGWNYVTFDISNYSTAKIRAGYSFVEFYVCDRSDTDNYGYDFTEYSSVNTKLTFYIDDITVDYSAAVDDREAPVFSDVTYATGQMADAATLTNGATITADTISFSASVVEDTAKSNYTGVDATSARTYIDGNAVDCQYAGGKITVTDAVLADGQHTVQFVVCDQMGNEAKVTRTLSVASGSGRSTVKLVPHDSTLDRILLGSVYYVDVVATDVEKVQTVSLNLDLNNISVWELEHMEVSDGFAAAYTVDATTNTAILNITRVSAPAATGEAVLVSMPIRTYQWGYTTHVYGSNKNKTVGYTTMKSLKEFWPIAINVEVDRGLVTFTDGSAAVFSGANVQVDTEMWAMCRDMIATTEGLAYYNSWNGGHEHRTEYASYYSEGTTNYTAPTALEDKAATCTEDGYTGRTYCETCKSVVDWGTTIPATGHTYVLTDGVLKCACGELFNGVFTDGKTYVDGIVHPDGWDGSSYYRDGVLLTGVQIIGNVAYDFGEDGVSRGVYTGLFEIDGNLYYAVVGVLKSGWIFEENHYYYFDKTTHTAVDGKATIDGYTYEFENWILVDGAWVSTDAGMKMMWAGKWCVTEWITVKGNTYYFNHLSVAVTGPTMIKLSTGGASQLAVFDDNGVFQHWVTNTGLVEYGGTLYYLNEGIGVYAGLIELDGAYYYINSQFKAVTGTYRITKTNGLMEAGEYLFGADGKMVVAKNGLVTDEDGQIRYYVDNVATYAGLVQDADGNYYYINSSLKAVRGTAYYITKTNSLLPAGEYIFGPDGKMIDPPVVDPDEPAVKQGLITDEDGQIRYYVDGVATYAGLVQDEDGNYYYINSTKKAVRGTLYVVTKTNGLLPSAEYLFGPDGKMVDPPVVDPEEPAVKQGLITDEDGQIRYYVDGVATYAGLVQDEDGNYYYINSTKKAVRGTLYVVTKTNGLLPVAEYLFGSDGKMVNPPV